MSFEFFLLLVVGIPALVGVMIYRRRQQSTGGGPVESPPAKASALFISYRRDDTAGFARAVYNALVTRFDRSQIFMDVDTIEPGLDFVRAIEDAVASCRVVVALIGRQWLTPRLAEPNDYVRIEIASALKRDIRVIPVLVDGAEMPPAESLPADVAAITRRNGLPLTHARFDADIERLAAVLAPRLTPQARKPAAPEAARPVEPAATARRSPEPPSSAVGQRLRWLVAVVAIPVFAGLGFGAGSLMYEQTRDQEMAWVAAISTWAVGAVIVFRMLRAAWRARRHAG